MRPDKKAKKKKGPARAETADDPSKAPRAKSSHASAVKQGQQVSGPSKPYRNISSNWTKYELPSDDEEKVMTGPDFNAVLENSSGASCQLRLKSEQEWDEAASNYTNQFFGLDLKRLEAAIHCIAIPLQIGLSEQDLDDRTRQSLQDEVTQRMANYKHISRTLSPGHATAQYEDMDQVAERILQQLSCKGRPESPLQEQGTTSVDEGQDSALEKWLDDFLAK